MDFADNIRVGMDLQHYAEALDEERRKIQVFRRELPLCLELVTRAIESCRQQLSGTTSDGGHSDSSEGPVLEEFIPMKKVSDEQSRNHIPEKRSEVLGRSDWLKTAQLWNQTPDPPLKEDVSKKTTVVEFNNNDCAFQPFRKNLKTNTPAAKSPAPVTETTTSSTAGSDSKKESTVLTQRKQRRCWSSELHRRFLNALQQLGGSHVATPKQIRELMKVDGLTNDEVKSHLQKYRLHTRRPSSATQNNGVSSTPPQFLVVGSIWVPPPATATATASGEASVVTVRNGIYSPATTPTSKTQRQRQKTSEEREGSHSRVVRSNSPATPSSGRTAETFPPPKCF